MSVRDFQNHPCPVCKSDTLHVFMCCQVCGHQQLHPYEQFESREPKGEGRPVKRMTQAMRARLYAIAQARRAK